MTQEEVNHYIEKAKGVLDMSVEEKNNVFKELTGNQFSDVEAHEQYSVIKDHIIELLTIQ